MKKIFTLAAALLLLVNVEVKAQGCAADTVYRWINDQLVELTDSERQNGIQLSCDHPSEVLAATVFAYGDPQGGYTFESIPYAPPLGFNTGTEVVLPKDDCWSKCFSLSFNNPTPPGVPPFYFNFYGEEYNLVSVSSNGNLRFFASPSDYGNYSTPDEAADNNPGAWTYCPYSSSHAFPDPTTTWGGNANPTLNGVSGPFHDIYFGSGTSYPGHMYFQIVGEYPCRKIVLSYYQVPLFGNTSQIATHMMVLYETTNVIEFYMENKPSATSTNGGNAVLGIQNIDGSEAVAINAPGHNYNNTVWSATNEAWRIRPTGMLGRELMWYKRPSQGPQAGELVGPLPTDELYRVVAQPTYDEGPTMYIAQATIYRLDGNEFVVEDSCLVKPYDIRPTIVAHNSATNPLTVAQNADSLAYIDTVCAGDNVVFRLQGGDRYYVVEPTQYANSNIVDSTITLTNTATEPFVKYLFKFENLDAAGNVICTRYDSCMIYNYSFEVDLGNDTTVCQGETVVYSDILGQDEGTYAWSTGHTTETLEYQPDNSQQVTLTITNAMGCTASDNAQVTVNQAPEVNITGKTEICKGTQTTLTANSNLGNCVYEWNNGENTAAITVSPNEDTEYTVSVKFPPAMCETIVSKTVKVKSAPVIFCNEDQKICNGETASIMVLTDETDQINYRWESFDESVNGSNQTSFIVAPEGTTHYKVFATNDFNCTSTDEVVVYVEQKPIPVITFSPSAIDALTPIVVFTDSTVGTVGTLWEISDGASSTDRVFVHTFDLSDNQDSYNVSLTATTEFGCVDSTSTIIRVKREHMLYAPTGVYLHAYMEKNATFRIYLDNTTEFRLQIYDRWGALVFETNDIEQAWDCKYKGENVQQGVYVWKATYRFSDSPNREHSDTGTFMIYN